MSEDRNEKQQDDVKPEDVSLRVSEDIDGETDTHSTPGEELPAETISAPSHSQRDSQHGKHGLFILILIIITGSFVAAGWYFFKQYEATVAELKVSLTDQQKRIDGIDRTTSGWPARMEGTELSIAQLDVKVKDLVSVTDKLKKQSKNLRSDWLVLEAEYLINIAIHRLLFERDVETAIAALQAADERLLAAGDPALVPVRKILLESIETLKAVSRPDISGISIQLSVVSTNIDKLPTLIPDPSKEIAGVDPDENREVNSWSDLPAVMWNDIKTLIVIRHHDEPIAPLLAPEQEYFLVENLRLLIEQARLAMLSGHTQVYTERLDMAIMWIEQHFDIEADITKTTLATLKQLKTINIAPALPDISQSYVAIQKYKQARSKQDK